MNNYELLYIVDNGLTDDEKLAVVEKVEKVITSNGGEIQKTDKWGTRKFAYPIDYKTEGYYVLVNFAGPANVPSEIDRLVTITDALIRVMTLKK